ncbi:MAG: hypothetical protein RBR02_06280 [Desulfuromonadaceae bacterium]|nr:hypothetical protein [Desulfuromonadaceae bacterium]
MLNIKQNKEKEGVELYFDEKPSKDTIKELKTAKFRFHAQKVCWYKKVDEATLKFAKNLQKKLNKTAVKTEA